jgi:hypothetical protein
MFINGEYPFQVYRYSVFNPSGEINDFSSKLKFPYGHPLYNQDIPSTDWVAMIVGTYWDSDDNINSNNHQRMGLRCFVNQGLWTLRVQGFDGNNDDDDQVSYAVDVLVIKKGFFDYYELSGPPVPGFPNGFPVFPLTRGDI